MVTTWVLPFSSSTFKSSASAYFLPNWKICPISIPLAIVNLPAQLGQTSPSLISAASIIPSAVKSLPETKS